MERRPIDPAERRVIDEIEDQIGRNLPLFDWFAGNRIFGVRIIKFHVFLLLVNNRGLVSLPKAIGVLSKLRALDAGRNKLKSLPDSLANCTSLSQLFLGRNQLQEFPQLMTNLHRLEILELQRNHFTTLPDLSNLSKMKRLYVYGNQLATLPSGLDTMTQLTEFRADDNLLESMRLPYLPHLEALNLRKNLLTEIDNSILHCPKLRKLDLSHNQLSTFPKILGDLPNLEQLYLGGNEIENLDYDTLAKFSRLKKLSLLYNPISKSVIEKLEAFTRLLPHDIIIEWSVTQNEENNSEFLI